METTTKLVALTTKTKRKLQVNDQVRGILRYLGNRVCEFCETVRETKNTFAEEICHTLAKITHSKIYANGYGVTVHLYIKHTEYSSTSELKAIIRTRINDLFKQL